MLCDVFCCVEVRLVLWLTCCLLSSPQEKYERALKESGILIVTPEWVVDSVKDKSRKDEQLYHPRLICPEEEEEDEQGSDYASRSDGSYSPRRSPRSRHSSGATSHDGSPVARRRRWRRRPGPRFRHRSSSRSRSPSQSRSRSPSPTHKPERRSERMFDDSDDSSPEKEERNLNWTPAEVPQPPAAPASKRRLPPGKDSGLINLCASVPMIPGATGAGGPALPTEVAGGGGAGAGAGAAERPEGVPGWSPAARTLRNITNSADVQQPNRPANVTHVSAVQHTHTP